jgi:hypothetical protein
MFKFLIIKNSALAQAEGNAIINIRIGSTAYIFGTKHQLEKRKKIKWYNPFPIRLEFFRPIMQCGMREIFCIGCAWGKMSYKTKGETYPGHYRWEEKGLKFTI